MDGGAWWATVHGVTTSRPSKGSGQSTRSAQESGGPDSLIEALVGSGSHSPVIPNFHHVHVSHFTPTLIYVAFFAFLLQGTNEVVRVECL